MEQPAVEVSSTFTAQELRRTRVLADELDDQLLDEALADQQFGVTQHLAGAPQLIEHWERARHVDVYGWAVLVAACDARRLGIFGPLPADLLRKAAMEYVDDEAFAEASPTWFDSALAYATRRLPGRARALFPMRGEREGEPAGYGMADYLLQHAARIRQLAPVPPRVWEILADVVEEPANRFRLAVAADNRMFYSVAAPLYRQMTELGDSYAAQRFCQLAVFAGAPDDIILTAFRHVIDGGDSYAQPVSLRDVSHLTLLKYLDEHDRESLHAAVLRRWADAGDQKAAEAWSHFMLSHHRTDQAATVVTDADSPEITAGLWIEWLLADGLAVEALEALRAATTCVDRYHLLRLAEKLARCARERAPERSPWISRRGLPPDYETAQAGWFDVLTTQGRSDHAWTLLRELAALSDDATVVLADVLWTDASRDEALQLLLARADDAALEWHEKHDSARRAAERLRELGRMEELEEFANRNGEAALILDNFLRDAEQYGRLASRAERGDQDAAFRLVTALRDLGQPEAALAVSRELTGSTAFALAETLELLEELGRHEEVLDLLDERLGADPDEFGPCSWAAGFAAGGDPRAYDMVTVACAAGGWQAAAEFLDALRRRQRWDVEVPDEILRALVRNKYGPSYGYRWIESLMAAGHRERGMGQLRVLWKAGADDAVVMLVDLLLKDGQDADAAAVIASTRAGFAAILQRSLEPLLTGERAAEATVLMRALVANEHCDVHTRESVVWRLADRCAQADQLAGLRDLIAAYPGMGAESELDRLLAARGAFDELEVRALDGDEHAAYHLKPHYYATGRLDEAETLLRTRAESGDARAADDLAQLRVARLPFSEAYELAHLGHPHAARRVVRALEKAGDTKLLWGEMDAGVPGAADVLLKVLTKQGEDETSARLAAYGRRLDGEVASELRLR